MHDDTNEFDRIMSQEFIPHPQPENPPIGPYGTPVKTGLTPRGKAAIAIGVTVIASGAFFSWQHYSAQQSANEAKAAEIQLQQQQLELEKLKVMNQVNAENTKVQTAADKTRQKQIDACVDDNKGLVGKQLGATYRSVLEDCQAQYPATTNTGDMANAASANDTSGSGGGGANGLVLGGIGAVGLGVVIAAKKGTRHNPA